MQISDGCGSGFETNAILPACCAHIPFTYLFLYSFFQRNTCFYSFRLSQKHIIILRFFLLYVVYTQSIQGDFFIVLVPLASLMQSISKTASLSRFRLCFCVLYPRDSSGHVTTFAHGIKWCTRPRDTSKCMVLNQDQLPTLPMERERAFNYSIGSICKYWNVAALASETNAILPPICAHISFVYYLIPFFRDKYLFYSFEHSQNHIISYSCVFTLCIHQV